MSIINEALKKAEKEKPVKQAQTETKAEAETKPLRKAALNNLSRLFVYLAVISVLFYASSAVIIFVKKKAFDSKVIPPKFTATAPEPGQPAVQQPIVQQPIVQQAAPLTSPAAPEATEKPAETEKAEPAAAYVPDEELPRPRLNGTMLGKGEPLAIIENIILKKGEYINGAQIADIFDNEVELEYKGRKYRIRTR